MFTISNIVAASMFSLLIGLIGLLPFFRRRPAVMHVLWIVVLAKFAAPAFISVPVLPAAKLVSVLPQVATPAPMPVLPTDAPHDTSIVATAPQSNGIVEKSAPIPWRSILLALSLAGTVVLLAHTVFRLAGLRR